MHLLPFQLPNQTKHYLPSYSLVTHHPPQLILFKSSKLYSILLDIQTEITKFVKITINVFCKQKFSYPQFNEMTSSEKPVWSALYMFVVHRAQFTFAMHAKETVMLGLQLCSFSFSPKNVFVHGNQATTSVDIYLLVHNISVAWKLWIWQTCNAFKKL